MPAETESVPRLRAASLLVATLAFALLVSFLSSGAHSALFAFALTLIATFSLLHGLGFFFSERAALRTLEWRELARPTAALLSSLLALLLALRVAVAGNLPYPRASSALLVTGAGAACLLSLAWLLDHFRCDDTAPRPLQRQGLWLMGVGLLLYVPMLGNFGLFDPWETHYGEVAREMIARDDWISFWWAQENWFWSKPALDFWLQGVSFLALGVHFQPDQMLAGAADGLAPAPEWAARSPVILLTLIANYLAYKAVAGVLGRRTGFVAGLALLLTPYWYFIAHQSMTDMPYAAPLTAALALVALGINQAPSAVVQRVAVRLGSNELKFSLAQLVLVLVVATALPQLAYLVSRNVGVFGVHVDRFMSGSGGGNCGLPGNDACEPSFPVNPELQPALLAALWGGALLAFLWLNRDEERTQRWSFIAAWYCVALSTLAKGAPGLVLPVMVSVGALAVTRRFRDLERLEWGSLGLLLVCVTLPWYVQALARHGTGFTDRLLFYDMYKRAFVHVHDTNAGDDVSFRYYLWQLGYGLFPLGGLALAGFLQSFGARSEASEKPAELLAFLGFWGVLGFSLFSVSLTKFHHYALPVAPALALLAGIALERSIANERSSDDWRAQLAATGCALLAALTALLGALWLNRGSLSGSPDTSGAVWLGSACLLVAVGVFGLGLKHAPPLALDSAPEARLERAAHGFYALLAAAAALLIGHDLYTDGSVPGQVRLINLFSYNYTRPWPASLEFSPAFRAASLVGALFLALLALPRFRPLAARAFLAVCFFFGVFALDVYLVKAAPHWGQRETILTYYATRSGPEEPLVAYQMNWKGENFYTGNHLPVFVTSGQKFRDWVDEQHRSGTRVMYFTTEHSRVGGLKNELGIVKSFQILTSEELNNKFVLTRVEL